MEANKQYQNILNQLETKIELLKEKIKRHSEKQSLETYNWGYVGDLGYVNDKIDEVTNFLK
jgi:hypothetical protein